MVLSEMWSSPTSPELLFIFCSSYKYYIHLVLHVRSVPTADTNEERTKLVLCYSIYYFLNPEKTTRVSATRVNKEFDSTRFITNLPYSTHIIV